MARSSRSRAAAAIQRTPTPRADEPSDGEIAGLPQEEGSQDEDVEQDQMELDDEASRETPALESDEGSGAATPPHGRGGTRRRRAGRPRGGARRRDATSQDLRDPGSDVPTPRKRGGWRGRGFGAGRWAKIKGGPSHVTQVPIDKEGNMANIVGDEVELPDDSEGEKKVTKDGELQGGREYRVRTFRIEGKGEKLYMLSTEPARCIGFRDSYLFFQKHKHLYKIIIAEDAKKDLIDRGLIPHSYKGRAIGVVTARSVFREFGAKIVVGGRKITDDYLVAEAGARGDVEGEYAVPEDEVPGGAEGYDRNRYVAWHGASAVYHAGASSVPLLNGKPVESKKRKVVVTGANWMYEHAMQASRFNSLTTAQRHLNLNGMYNVHTNFMQYPKIMQPTQARWERVESRPPASHTMRTQNNVLGDETGDDPLQRAPASDAFPELPSFYTQRFMVTDTYFETPSTSTLGYPGPDEALVDIGPLGLMHVPQDVVEALPEDCQEAFVRARTQEKVWKTRWKLGGDGRTPLRITYNT
ncbi:uncharacterized protein KY384_000650 [Bacidia gigantensis]|uniref:uncharacterized protein n=1 Tax=Bacidia gigantensis TaxID=2732470 RepID=UPI001D048EC4|nr:uncharacterized protein KY384_000650 [Bacidia gigantensis]KAG8525890.1 hypothetical protein KY384_000650 [Bacidia gigantensis]